MLRQAATYPSVPGQLQPPPLVVPLVVPSLFPRYSKRALVAGVYSAMELYMLTDTSPGALGATGVWGHATDVKGSLQPYVRCEAVQRAAARAVPPRSRCRHATAGDRRP